MQKRATSGECSQRPQTVSTGGLSGLSREELEQAFALFTEASQQLTSSYQELQQQVGRLTHELEIANGELRRQYQEKAALSERLSTVLQALPAAVVEVDAGGVIRSLNPAAVRLLGEGYAGQPWEGVAARLQATVAPDEYEWPGPPRRRLHMASNPLSQAGGQIMLLSDISENYQIRQELERHQRLSQMGEMAARLAHQLRTPLAAALLYAGNLGRRQLGEEDRQRFAQKTVDRLKYLESLIQQMLWFVKGQQAGVERVPVQDVLAEVAALIEPHMQRGGYAFEWHHDWPPAAMPAVQVERKTLIGVLVNLLENAIQASSSGQPISLEGSCQDGQLELRVRDAGCGIAEEHLERLFDPFFTTRSDGTGLGLAIVRQAVEGWGGHVHVSSRPGHGSCFIIALPLAA